MEDLQSKPELECRGRRELSDEAVSKSAWIAFVCGCVAASILFVIDWRWLGWSYTIAATGLLIHYGVRLAGSYAKDRKRFVITNMQRLMSPAYSPLVFPGLPILVPLVGPLLVAAIWPLPSWLALPYAILGLVLIFLLVSVVAGRRRLPLQREARVRQAYYRTEPELRGKVAAIERDIRRVFWMPFCWMLCLVAAILLVLQEL